MAEQIGSYFTKKHNHLNSLVKRAGGLGSLESRFLARLDPALREHIRITDLSRDSVTLLTDSSARCSQLRFMVPGFLAVFHDLLGSEDLQQVKILTGQPADFRKVSSSLAKADKNPPRPRPAGLGQLKKLLK